MNSKLFLALILALSASMAFADCLPGTIDDGNGNCAPAFPGTPGVPGASGTPGTPVPAPVPPPEVPMDPTVGMQISAIVFAGHIVYRPTNSCTKVRIFYYEADQQKIFIANKDGKPMVCGDKSYYLGQVVGSTSFQMYNADDVMLVNSNSSAPLDNNGDASAGNQNNGNGGNGH